MQLDRSGRASAFALAITLLLAALLLAACGSSSSPTTKTANTAGGATGSTGKRGARFTELRECLQKQGITLPTPKQSQGKPGSGSPPGSGVLPFGGGTGGGPFSQLPKGVTRAQFDAALKKCGSGKGFRGFNGTGRLRSPSFTKALAGFAECMRKNGIAVPKPNTSGKGPIFSTKGIDTTSAKFRAAEQKCSSLLRIARPGAAGGAASGGPYGAPSGAPGGAPEGAPPVTSG